MALSFPYFADISGPALSLQQVKDLFICIPAEEGAETGLAHTPQVNSGTECAGSSHYQDLLSANILGVFGF